ncbi:GNAT family N-acetyltransferase [filamentous cyanobacterium LEGE 11480]|uniref:GNAT family N-acetyltransferase n=1 Tax=Romeriopsis navalis LEGE 11480 TaxID=2777977 RepID=A0A928Z3F4_9CYAN|nr:GNAT family N-acetyltransferase [Romeriopsis navalis]MBE9029972.1 GNAT family N-acetyltransferase [Romeriopsis navalis LEGE 11480]
MSHIASGYRIRLAELSDLAQLPAIEQAAAQQFQATPYSFIADLAPMSMSRLHQLWSAGKIWLVIDAMESPVGFAIIKFWDELIYLHEIDVHPRHTCQGLGRALVETICDWGKLQNYQAVVLSTFQDIPWNGAFYAKCGFQMIPQMELSPQLQQVRAQEVMAGLPIQQRICMRRHL